MQGPHFVKGWQKAKDSLRPKVFVHGNTEYNADDHRLENALPMSIHNVQIVNESREALAPLNRNRVIAAVRQLFQVVGPKTENPDPNDLKVLTAIRKRRPDYLIDSQEEVGGYPSINHATNNMPSDPKTLIDIIKKP